MKTNLYAFIFYWLVSMIQKGLTYLNLIIVKKLSSGSVLYPVIKEHYYLIVYGNNHINLIVLICFNSKLFIQSG